MREFLPNERGTLSDDSLEWQMLNQEALQHSAEGNLGLCRNACLLMADFLLEREKLNEALRLYFVVCAYDLNGAQNRGGLPEKMLPQFPLYDPKMATLAPVVVKRVLDITETLSLAADHLRDLYLKSTTSMNFPISPEKAWSIVSLAVEGKVDLNDQPRCFQQIRSMLV